MTLTNHALAGAAIGLLIPNPWVAIPLAVASHAVLDALPHFGGPDWYNHFSRRAAALAATDTLGSAVVVSACLVQYPGRPWVAAAAVAATVPDWLWLWHYATASRHWYFRIHTAIQRFERPWGAAIEAAFALMLIPYIYL